MVVESQNPDRLIKVSNVRITKILPTKSFKLHCELCSGWKATCVCAICIDECPFKPTKNIAPFITFISRFQIFYLERILYSVVTSINFPLTFRRNLFKITFPINISNTWHVIFILGKSKWIIFMDLKFRLLFTTKNFFH